MEETKPWYQSKTIWSSIVVLMSVIAGTVGYDISQAEQIEITELILAAVSAAGALAAIVSRKLAIKKIGATETTTE